MRPSLNTAIRRADSNDRTQGARFDRIVRACDDVARRCPSPRSPPADTRSKRLPVLLSMAMFVLVVDTSLMNVSISSVVEDLDATVSGVQSAIALEALVSAAFILIGSKIGDLFGRKRAYVLGLLGYAAGALSMAFAQNVDHDRHLLGDPRRARRLAAAAVDAVADPRQLRRGRAEAASTRWSALRRRSQPRSAR